MFEQAAIRFQRGAVSTEHGEIGEQYMALSVCTKRFANIQGVSVGHEVIRIRCGAISAGQGEIPVRQRGSKVLSTEQSAGNTRRNKLKAERSAESTERQASGAE